MVVLQPSQGAGTVLEVPSFFRLLGNRQCMYKAIMLAYSKEINIFHNSALLSQLMIYEFIRIAKTYIFRLSCQNDKYAIYTIKVPQKSNFENIWQLYIQTFQLLFLKCLQFNYR